MKALCTPLGRVSLPRAAGTGLVTFLLVLVACEAPTPIVDEEVAVEPAVEAATGDVVQPTGEGPIVYVDGVRIGRGSGVRPSGGRINFRLDGERWMPNLDDLDPASIDRVEVIKGDAARARFGPEAAQGVIQIFTKEGGEEGAEDSREAAPVPAPDIPAADPEADLSAAPVFTPYTLAPQLRNVSEVQRALEVEYPALLRDAGIGGQVLVHFFIDADGVVQDTRVASSSGHRALDEAALRVGGVFRFSPALNRDTPTAVWIALPITFQARGGEEEAGSVDAVPPRTRATPPRPEVAPPPPPGEAGGADGPTFTPYTQAPRLLNTAEVQAAMEREYPPVLREAGIGGRALVHFRIDETGAVTDTRLDGPSGHAALDQAALRLADEFRFAPAQNEGTPVAVWIAIPITFQAP